MASKKAVIGLVATQTEAENIFRTLQIGGFSTGEISVLLPEEEETHDFAHEQSTEARAAAVPGANIGGTFGEAFGLSLDFQTFAIPGVGHVGACGPIVAALSGGASTGGLTRVLVGMGIPELEAARYEGQVQRGSVLLTVHAPEARERTRAKYAMENGGATDIVTIGEQTVPITAWRSAAPRT